MAQTISEPLDISSELPSQFPSSPWEDTIERYFEFLSAGDFPSAANLFAEEGILHPPFDRGVVGSAAILDYLNAEAIGMNLEMLKITSTALENGGYECEVLGKVHTAFFTVNAGWSFNLNGAAEIESVRVKLLAALQELLALKPEREG